MGNKQYPSKLAAWKKLIYEPKKLALMNTTIDPIHIITKTEVIIVLLSLSVRIDKVAQSRRHNTSGPQRSPTFDIIYNFEVIYVLFLAEKAALHI
jgi:hypothetical protein